MAFLAPLAAPAMAAARALPAISSVMNMIKPSEPKPEEQQQAALGKNAI